ncbi:MAG: hypothetical protein L3J78_03025 [Thermoplasmata archaeon]|nr:hypothetical protein [Thermoplasmata archaeon]
MVLESKDLRTFTFAAGYNSPVMSPPIRFTNCGDHVHDFEFDENYAAPGSVVRDPTLPPGNLMMIYEAENHCPGGAWQFPFYATVGFARSSDHGKTWPQPVNSDLGGPDRYPILKSSTPEPTTPENPQVALGDALPSAFVDTGRESEQDQDSERDHYLYVTYILTGPGADGMIRVARARLGDDGQLGFSK